MDLKMIAWGMVIILAILFIITPMFRKKEKQNNELEITFFEALKTYKSLPSSENKNKLEEALNTYYQHLGMSEEQIQQKKLEIF